MFRPRHKTMLNYITSSNFLMKRSEDSFLCLQVNGDAEKVQVVASLEGVIFHVVEGNQTLEQAMDSLSSKLWTPSRASYGLPLEQAMDSHSSKLWTPSRASYGLPLELAMDSLSSKLWTLSQASYGLPLQKVWKV